MKSDEQKLCVQLQLILMELSRDQPLSPTGRAARTGIVSSLGQCWQATSSTGRCVLVAAPCLSHNLVSQKSPYDMLKLGSVASNNAVMT